MIILLIFVGNAEKKKLLFQRGLIAFGCSPDGQ
jgi:hypothetical protein